MTLVVDIRPWLDDQGDIPFNPARLRRNALRVAQLIEYGGPLHVGDMRETLVPCTKRPRGKPCPGLMWVVKEADQRIHAYCHGRVFSERELFKLEVELAGCPHVKLAESMPYIAVRKRLGCDLTSPL